MQMANNDKMEWQYKINFRMKIKYSSPGGFPPPNNFNKQKPNNVTRSE